MNWAEVVSYLQNCPPSRTKEHLIRHAMGKCKVKPVRAKIRIPRGSKPKSISVLKKELDRVFSIFTRTKDADENGMVKCVTCSRVAHWKDVDAGHYVPRQDLATRWEPRNCWPQCRPDNAFRGGEPEKMAAYINETCGAGVAESLRAQARQSFKLSRSWLEMKIAEYKQKIGEGK